MATRTPKIPARSTLLNSSLDGMDDLFDFKTKEDLSQPEQENGGTGITEMDFAVMEPLPNHKFKLYTGQRLWDMVDSINKLAFNHVSFGYFSTNVLSDISFSICKPGLYSFVGKNGAGKTTLLKLLSKLYEVESGSITVNDKNIDSISTSTLRNSITFMMKEPLIISGSLWENLVVGAKGEIKETDIINICKKVQLTSLVEKIGGYQSTINADSLSSGEKQKIGLVRVLLRKSSVIMLDEVTSDLDGNIENIVISLLEELANSAIIINVCHRKKLVESSTYIFVIEENRGIVETGTHQELKEKKGRYNELF